jgi:hypothetical protein
MVLPTMVLPAAFGDHLGRVSSLVAAWMRIV